MTGSDAFTPMGQICLFWDRTRAASRSSFQFHPLLFVLLPFLYFNQVTSVVFSLLGNAKQWAPFLPTFLQIQVQIPISGEVFHFWFDLRIYMFCLIIISLEKDTKPFYKCKRLL